MRSRPTSSCPARWSSNDRSPIAGPHDVLLGQLDLIDQRLASVADDMARHDSDALLAKGRFLADKFGVSSLRVDADPVAVAAALPSHSSAASSPSVPGPGAPPGAEEHAGPPQHGTGH